jgi:hypothetical protein
MTVRDVLDPPATVMLVGSIHFASNRDLVNTGGYDATTSERQSELDDLCERLARFDPSIVAVERLAEEGAQVQARYEGYLTGERGLRRSEDEQIGFRLAKLCGLDAVTAIDDMSLPFWSEELDGLVASDAGVRARLHTIRSIAEAEVGRSLASPTLLGMFRAINADERPGLMLAPYMLMIPWTSGHRHLGAEAIANWYERNLRILGNLMAALGPGERAVVVIGEGHLGPLAHFIEMSPELALESVAPYLD